MLLADTARDHLLLHFARNGSPDPLLVLERGEGPYVFDTEGGRYLDGLSSLFCAQLGYSYGEEMAQVAGAQLQQLAFSTVWGAAHPTARTKPRSAPACWPRWRRRSSPRGRRRSR